MITLKPVFIVDEIGDVVTKVSAALLTQLQILDDKIEAVNYLYGHPLEIIETLKQRDEADNFRFKKYPLIALFQDFPERKGYIGIDSETTLHLIIARATEPTYKADERYTFNFKPFLYLIYLEFLKQLNFSKAFTHYGAEQIEHTKYDRLYWGREGLYKNEGNIFNDWLDCIEIRDLRLKVNLKIC